MGDGNWRTCYKIGCTRPNTPTSWFCLEHQAEDREWELNDRTGQHLQAMAAAEYEQTGSCKPLGHRPGRLMTARNRAIRDMGLPRQNPSSPL